MFRISTIFNRNFLHANYLSIFLNKNINQNDFSFFFCIDAVGRGWFDPEPIYCMNKFEARKEETAVVCLIQFFTKFNAQKKRFAALLSHSDFFCTFMIGNSCHVRTGYWNHIKIPYIITEII